MRRDHRKLRTGCKQCRRRRVKCDEAKPTCAACIRNKLQCSFEFLTPSLPRLRHKEARESILPSSWGVLPSTSPFQDLGLHHTSLDLDSMELLHHFTSVTYLTFGDDKRNFLWKNEIPRMAISHDFLMHGLLAVSALHLSTLQPHRKEELIRRATISEHLGLPSFRSFVSRDDPHSIHAVVAFAGFVVPYVCGSRETLTGRIPSLDDEHPHWFFAFRGLLQMVGRSWMALRTGPFGSLLEQGPVFTLDSVDHPDDMHLIKVYQILESSSSTSETDIDMLEVCKAALDELRRLFACPHEPMRTRVMIAIHVWPGTVSQRFVELMQERRPEALVILAHYCVLLKKVDSCWWLAGVGNRMLAAIDEALGLEWRPWIEWPLDHPLY
ncbi:hypothetical protein N431DRAFT_393968 [Stipitochalara longipes BDJ]|nr:hypothetical protein N431DRAFT_393968 [Stipitochalara longipes BDJ]